MYRFGEIEPKVSVPSLKMTLSLVSLAMWEWKWHPRFAEISSFPTRGHSSKSAKWRQSKVERFGRKALSPCGRIILQFVCSDGAFGVVFCPGKTPSTSPKGKAVFFLEFLRTQQWGLGLDFKSRRPHLIFHDCSCGPCLPLRIAVNMDPGHAGCFLVTKFSDCLFIHPSTPSQRNFLLKFKSYLPHI